jgi:PilZ domain-containing protein
MSIEHRWMPRQSARLPVSIACRPFGLLRGRLRDISNGGAMVQLGARLPSNAPVELVLPVCIGGDDRIYHLPAIVTRSGESGVGLMFGRIDSEMWAALLAEIKPRPNDVEFADDAIRGVPAASRL